MKNEESFYSPLLGEGLGVRLLLGEGLGVRLL